MAILKVRDKDGNVIDIPAVRGKSAYEYAKDGGYTGTEEDFQKKLAKDIPEKLTELENDSEFITNTVDNLTNYYLKSETYTQDEVKALVSAIPKFSIQVVDTLPTEDISTTTVYLVKNGEETDNLYTEYIYVNGAWEYLGKQTVDLSGYALAAAVLKKDNTEEYTPTEDYHPATKKYVDESINELSEDLNDLRSEFESGSIGGGSGTGLSVSAISLLDSVGNHLEFKDAQGGAIWDALIAELRKGGSGEDSPIMPTFVIALNLSNANASNMDTTIAEGSSYTNTISAISGYTLSEVSCTMDGVSVPVNNGVISISSVSGDIIINAVAEKQKSAITLTRNQYGALSFYNDNGSSLLYERTAGLDKYYSDVFDTDTEVKVDYECTGASKSAIYVGSMSSDDITKAYYSELAKAQANGVVGETGSYTYTVKAGYRFVVATSLGNNNFSYSASA